MRIAQDLHDDIGARLLTLMYKAANSEVEDYIRHTLHELKTLTRGLAAKDHRLSHAVGEWKADIANRLSVARCELEWSFSYDDDVMLTVVQWSALTRILRELVNNIIAHGKAGHVWLEAQLIDRHLRIRVADDGEGRAPQQWRPGPRCWRRSQTRQATCWSRAMGREQPSGHRVRRGYPAGLAAPAERSASPTRERMAAPSL